MQADADGGGFLPGVEVGETGNLSRRELGVHTLLELADGPHVLVGVQ
jgi:hypothetical protein